MTGKDFPLIGRILHTFNDPHFVTATLRNLENGQIADYPNKSKVSKEVRICFGYLQDQVSVFAA